MRIWIIRNLPNNCQMSSRAAELGVTEMISIGVRLDTAHKPRQLAESYDNTGLCWYSPP